MAETWENLNGLFRTHDKEAAATVSSPNLLSSSLFFFNYVAPCTHHSSLGDQVRIDTHYGAWR